MKGKGGKEMEEEGREEGGGRACSAEREVLQEPLTGCQHLVCVCCGWRGGEEGGNVGEEELREVVAVWRDGGSGGGRDGGTERV